MNRRDTEPYVRWCGRTVRFIPHLLPDGHRAFLGTFWPLFVHSVTRLIGGRTRVRLFSVYWKYLLSQRANPAYASAA